MKKIISMLLVLSMLLFVAIVPAYAETTENIYLYEERFIEEYVYDIAFKEYKEVYYHYDENSEIDWCLINATASGVAQNMAIYLKIDDFVISTGNFIYPFYLKYAVYDVKNDKFVDLIDNYDELSNYDGLFDVLKTVDNSFIIGDADHDGELSILDATAIQLAVAGKIDLNIGPYTDRRTLKKSNYYDVDDDGEFSVMDATAIQKKLAKIEI